MDPSWRSTDGCKSTYECPTVDDVDPARFHWYYTTIIPTVVVLSTTPALLIPSLMAVGSLPRLSSVTKPQGRVGRGRDPHKRAPGKRFQQQLVESQQRRRGAPNEIPQGGHVRRLSENSLIKAFWKIWAQRGRKMSRKDTARVRIQARGAAFMEQPKMALLLCLLLLQSGISKSL